MAPLPLREFHLRKGARFGEVAGHETVLNYGETEAEYQALTLECGVLDLSFRSRLCVLGADRIKFLHGQVTNEVAKLTPGMGCYAALINNKGKMQSDLFVYPLREEVLLDFEPGLTERVSERLKQYIIADDAQVTDVAPFYGLLSLQGPKAAEAVISAGLELPGGNLSWKAISAAEGDIYIMNNPRLNSAGYDVYAPAEAMPRVAESIRARWCGLDAFEIARIEEGIPRYGADMDESNLAPEAGIESRAISYAKGCYIGQEVVARIRTYGQVAKALRLLRLPEGGNIPGRGEKLLKKGREVGWITSSTRSPKRGFPVALGYVRKECNAPGERVELASGGAAEVLAAPI